MIYVSNLFILLYFILLIYIQIIKLKNYIKKTTIITNKKFYFLFYNIFSKILFIIFYLLFYCDNKI